MIIDQMKTKHTDETDVIIVNADMIVGMMISMDAPSNRQIQENSSPSAGTRRDESLPNLRGATPTSPRP